MAIHREGTLNIQSQPSSPAVTGRGSINSYRQRIPRQWLRGMTTWAICLLPFAICHASSITGFVKFPGEAPPRNMFANASDHDCPHGIAQTHLLLNPYTLGLQNALVVLDRDDRRVMPTRLQVELSTVGCQLIPRIQWVPLGASLALVDKDGATHHLHATLKGNTLFEADLTPEVPNARRPAVVPGLYKVNCDRHPWERAWIYVSPHDSVAISDSKGHFVMKNVPPGHYKIRVWHEGWLEQPKDPAGRLEFKPMQDFRDVKVRENQETTVTFDTLVTSGGL